MLGSDFWKNYFKVYDVLNLLIPYQELLEIICNELEIKPGDKILEAGCGTGNLVLKIKEGGAKVTGLDNCKEALDICHKKCPELILADLEKNLPFADGYFDKISSNNTLYAVSRDKRDQLMKEFLRILKPGGKIVLANPREGWKPRKIYLRGIKDNIEKEGGWTTITKVIKMIIPTIKMFYYNHLIQKEVNYYFFGLNEQKVLLQKAGFTNISETKSVYANEGIMNSAYKE